MSVPVLLPGVPRKPELPPFLASFTWVDLRQGLDDRERMCELVQAILARTPF